MSYVTTDQQENLADENYLAKWHPTKLIATIPSKGGQMVEWK